MIYTLGTNFDGIDGVYIEEVGEHPQGAFIMGRKMEDWDGKPLQFTFKNSKLENPIPWDYLDYCHLISKRLLKAIQDAGVENIEVIPTVIKSEDGKFMTEDYVGINVLGGIHDVMSVRDDKLVVDMAKVPPLLFFMYVYGKIACNEKVAKAILGGKFIGIDLVPIHDK